MSIRIEDFLDEYVDEDVLNEALRSIGITPPKTKEECINRLLNNWTARNRSWFQILDFLDYEELCTICDHFDIMYYHGVEHPEDLIEKIRRYRIIDFTKKYVPKEIPNPSKNQRYVVFPLIGWMVIGIVIATLNFSGVFMEMHEEEIDISKNYQVSYQSWKDENTLSAIIDNISLSGTIFLQSTQFSAHNEIDVFVELSPNTGTDAKDRMMLDSIPPPLNLYFTGAQHVYLENDRPLADIQLTRSFDRTKLIGEGTISYAKGDDHEIYFLDASEIGLKQELLTVNKPNNALVLFPQNEKTLDPEGYYDEQGARLTIPTVVEFVSTTEPYLIEIKQSDAQNSLGSDRMDAFAIWITLAFAPYAIIPMLKYFSTNKLTS